MKMFCITHKRVDWLEDVGVIPLVVGGAPDVPRHWLRDDSLDNISKKNKNYCELTGQYWVWRNVLPTLGDDELVGFCHYRRFFSLDDVPKLKSTVGREELVNLSDESWERVFKTTGASVILAEPERLPSLALNRRLKLIRQQGVRISALWRPSCLWYQFALHHDPMDLVRAIQALDGTAHQVPFKEYLLRPNRMHSYNMYVASKKAISDYFDVLFPWLSRCEDLINLEGRTPYQARIFGFLAERFASYYFSSMEQARGVPVQFVEDV